MPREKPKVIKRNGRWVIRKPRYGFHHGDGYEYFGPFDSHDEAMRVAGAEYPVSSGCYVDRTYTPESYWYPEIWPPIIR